MQLDVCCKHDKAQHVFWRSMITTLQIVAVTHFGTFPIALLSQSNSIVNVALRHSSDQ